MAATETEEIPEAPALLTAEQHYAISVTLFAFAIIGTVMGSMNIRMFLSSPELISKGGIFYLNMVITDVCMAMLESPFTAISHMYRSWFLGDFVCQTYSFAGMFFGITNIFMLMFISLDRFWTISSPTDAQQKAKYYTYMVAFGWLSGLVWAAAPLPPFGWSSYAIEISGASCALDYMTNDATYVRYIIALTLCCFVVPITIMLYSYGKAISVVKGSGKVTDWADETNVSLQSGLCLLQVVFCWGLYGVNCLWTAFADANTLPKMFTVVAPILAKSSPIINSYLYIYRIRRFRGAVGDMFKPKED